MAPVRLTEPLAPHFLLYRNAPDANANGCQKSLVASGNTDHGLRFTKFFGRWQGGEATELIKPVQTDETDRHGNPLKPKPTNPLLDWLDPRKPGNNYRIPDKPFKTQKAGQSDRLTEANRRLQALATRSGGKYLELSLVSRLLIGIGLPHPIENGFLFHPTLGVPYVPGTALKQVARDWAEEKEQLDSGELDRLFGHPDSGVGCIAFLDALPKAPLTLTTEQITNHYLGYYQNIDPANPPEQRPDMYQPADWHEPNPVSLLAVEATLSNPAAFGFGMLPLRGASTDDTVRVKTWLTNGLETYGVGARSTLGFGRFESEEAIQTRRRLEEQMRRELEAEEQEMAKSAPPSVGERMYHSEWTLVEVLEIVGDQVRVYSIDEAEEVTLPISELTRR